MGDKKLDQVKEEVSAKLEALLAEVRAKFNPRHANIDRVLALLNEARSNVAATNADDGAGNGALPD